MEIIQLFKYVHSKQTNTKIYHKNEFKASRKIS